MEWIYSWWFSAISIIVCFAAVFIIAHKPKWPSITWYGTLAGTAVGLIALFFYPYMTILLVMFAFGTVVGRLVDLIVTKSKK